jgi:hypothetical protein
MFGDYKWERLYEKYPDATLYGDNPVWHDVEQGYAGTCYILAAMGSLSEFPEILKETFVTKEVNKAGIYAIRFYIRGKPWHITVDDEMLFYQDELNFARLGDNKSIWGPIVEKAWAKMKGTFEHANGGFTPNGIRALTGVPVF